MDDQNLEWVNQRLNKVINSSIDFLDLIELYQISMFIKKIKKGTNTFTDSHELLSRISEINKKLQRSFYDCYQIVSKLQKLDNMEKLYFTECNQYFWLFLINFQKMKNDDLLVIMNFCYRKFGGSLLLQEKLCKKFESQISSYMLNDHEMLFPFYKNLDNLGNFPTNIYKNGKKEIIIENFLNQSAEKDLNVLNFISTDKKISLNPVKNVRLSRKAGNIRDQILPDFDLSVENINGVNYIGFAECFFPIPSNLFDLSCLNDNERILRQSNLLDQLSMCSAPSGLIRPTLVTEIMKQEYVRTYYPYELVKLKDLVSLNIFCLYIEKLKEKKMSFIDVINSFLRETLPDKFNIRNFIDIQIKKEDSLDEQNNVLCNFIHALIKIYDGYAETKDINSSDLFDLKVPKFENIRSIVPKKYVTINDSNVITLAKTYNQFSYIFENSNYVLKDYDKININLLLKNRIIEVSSDNKVEISNDGYLNLLKLLNNYGEIPYNEICDKKTKSIIDKLINEGKAEFKSTLLNKRESDYISYFIDDKFTNGLGIRNVYMHGSGLKLSKDEHKKNETRLLYVICLLLLKMIEEFKLYTQ
ncbi:hypothetical protein [Apilactobacillus kunkeei]|uniref:hypothetical protein n=1 Tax=Apilactobacillus kunkeei TaxID=148814 RepID=UPI00117A9BE1|nr:hypothetical protein [Apilactobacillus kunkeei]